MNKLFLFLIVISTSLYSIAEENIANNIIEQAKKSSVKIEIKTIVSALGDNHKTEGTGFIVDKKAGIIVTNTHIAGIGSVCNYYASFYNGKKVEAKVIYYDLWQDYAIMKVDPKELPDTITEIVFSEEVTKLGQLVFIIGNNQSQSFSFHSGHISNLYEINGILPQHSYVINLNSAGGSSGSPVLNTKGEAVALNYGGGKTYALALKGEYVKNALKNIKAGTLPVRKHFGAIISTYSLDDASFHRGFPKDKMNEYLKEFPDSYNKVLKIDYIFNQSIAGDILKAGDIIWATYDKKFGPNLYNLDFAMDNAKDNKLKLTIFRDGEFKDVEVPLYNINDNKINRFVHFGGAVFYEADDLTCARSGVPLRSVFIFSVDEGGSFSEISAFSRLYSEKNSYGIRPIALNQYSINNLDDLIKVIPELIKKKYIKIDYKTYSLFSYHFNYFGAVTSQVFMSNDIILNKYDTGPRIFKYNTEANEWEIELVAAE